MPLKTKVVFITGPTACGKTDLVHHIVRSRHDLIINSDSRQFYQHLSIGTAKPSQQELDNYSYRLIDFLKPGEAITAFDFLKQFMEIIHANPPDQTRFFLVGGTLFYLDIIKNGLPVFPPIPKHIKTNLEKILEEKGLPYLCDILKEKDPEYYRIVDLNNPRRILRALEVIESGGDFSKLRKQRQAPPLEILQISLVLPRNILYQRIDDRIEQMFAQGWVDEVSNLLEQFSPSIITSVNAIGYQEVIQYLQGSLNYSDMIKKIKQKTKQMAKRQLNWIKKENRSLLLVTGYNNSSFDETNQFKNKLDQWMNQKTMVFDDNSVPSSDFFAKINPLNKKTCHHPSVICTENIIETVNRIIGEFYE